MSRGNRETLLVAAEQINRRENRLSDPGEGREGGGELFRSVAQRRRRNLTILPSILAVGVQVRERVSAGGSRG